MLFGVSFDQIDAATIQNLIASGVSESVSLDFKRDAYGNADDDKKELLKDVSSFANTRGGYLVIGMSEVAGVACAIVPLAVADIDRELQRLESILRTGIEPQIVGLRMKPIDVQGGKIIAVYVPASYNPPHRVAFKGSYRFYARNSAGCHELGLEELRVLFGQQRSIEEGAAAFIESRTLAIHRHQGSMPLPPEATLVLHMVPVQDAAAKRRIELGTLRKFVSRFEPMRASGYSHRFNLEGLCVFRGGPTCHGYTQIFRDGSVEATSTSMFAKRDDERVIPSVAFPQSLIATINSYLRGCQELGVSVPILVQLSAFSVLGVRMGVDPWLVSDQPPPYDRPTWALPPSLILEYRGDGNYEHVVAEQMHFLWNIYGFERCFFFDGDGRWNPPK